MKLRRAFLVGVTAWVAVVLVGTTLVWTVISRAGQDLVAGGGPLEPGAESTGPGSPAETIEPGHPLRRGQRSDRPDASSSATAGDGSSSGGSAGAPPSATGQPPRAGQDPSPSSSATVRTDTWRGAPGSVTISCKGSTVMPNYVVSAADGWRPEAPSYSPEKLEVHFERSSGGGEHEITGACVGGRPRWEVRSEGESDGD